MENMIIADANQISMFDLPAEKNTKKKASGNDKLPEEISGFTGEKTWNDLEAFLAKYSDCAKTVIYKKNRYCGHYPEYYGQAFNIDIATPVTKFLSVPGEGDWIDESYNLLRLEVESYNSLKGILVYVTQTGAAYEATVLINASVKEEYNGPGEITMKSIEISKWKKASLHGHNIMTIVNDGHITEILENVNPYAAKFLKEVPALGLEAIDLILAPQLEQLIKAGYSFVHEEVIPCLNAFDASATLACFNRLCKPGKNMKEIFKTSKAVYQTLMYCSKLEIWDIYRKMAKMDNLSAENIDNFVNHRYTKKDLDEVHCILSARYNEKPIFTVDSLQRYLERIDMYEAIDRTEGLLILADYLRMCKQLEIKPRIDGDSLKREHDVTARTLRQRRDDIMANKMLTACEENKKYDYSEHVYFGRCIRDYDDLINEAMQQHNCVASYSSSIAAKRTYIFVVRELANPNKSLATVEITPSGEIRQKYLAYNQPIRNKSLTEFIDRLAKNFKEG